MEKILVVDDEESLTDAIVEFLSEYFECEGVYSFKDAIDRLKRERFDVVVSDVKLKDGNGLQILSYLKENAKDTKVIIITAYGSPSLRLKSLREGAIMYIEKPVDLNLLLASIKRALRSLPPIRNMDLIDLLKFLSTYSQSVNIKVETEKGSGCIRIKDRRVEYARTEDKSGIFAIFDMLSWDKVKIRLESCSENKTNLDIQIDDLLFQIEEGNMVSSEVRHILERFEKESNYIIGSGLYDIENNRKIGRFPYSDIYRDVVVENINASKKLRLGRVEEILITTESILILIKVINDELFWIVGLTPDANLGLIRVLLKKYEDNIYKTLKRR